MYRDLSLQQLADIVQAKIVRLPADKSSVIACSICTDSRKLQAGDVYLALSGERFDGHDFVVTAAAAGAVAALVEREIEADIPQLLVENSLAALAQLAAWQRRQFEGPVVGITGSSGKTTVKQLMASVLQQTAVTWMTQGNLNNHIGVPLTLLSLQPEHQAAVIEMGASAVGEIAYTANLVAADVAIITNASESHLQGFGSLQGIVQTKGELLDYLADDGCAVLNYDDPYCSEWLQRAAQHRHLTFGLSAKADVYASQVVSSLNGVNFRLHCPQGESDIQLPLLGRHNVLNALAVAAAAAALNISLADIQRGLNQAQAFSGRLQWRSASAGIRLLDDSYNANPASMCAAIDVLADAGRGFLVMGDMGELGERAIAAHQQVGRYAQQRGIFSLLACGELSTHAVAAFNQDNDGQGGHVFSDQEALVTYLQQHAQPGDVVLVKGSRSAKMDQVVRALQLENEDN